MTIEQLLKHFGGSQTKVADALGVRPQAVHQWVTNKKIPIGRQYQAQALSGGELVACNVQNICSATSSSSNDGESIKNNDAA